MKKVRDYLLGYYRYHVYYYKDGKFRFLIRNHIKEQFEMRLEIMDKECLERGQCKECGCDTTALQFAKKKCAGFCYPPFVSPSKWKKIKELLYYPLNGDLVWRIYDIVKIF